MNKEVFKKVGLSVFQKKFIKPLPIADSGNVDRFQILLDGIESFYVNDIEELPICVTEKERESFIDKYKSLSLKELSAQIFVFYARKK